MQVETLWTVWDSFITGLRPADWGIDALLQSLHEPLAAWLAAVAIVLAAVVSAIWFLGRLVWPSYRLIVMASKAVEGAADQPAFTASFPRFDRAMNEIPLLRRPWAQFRAGIIVPPQSARAAVRHHLRAGDYLNLAGLEAGGFNFRYFDGWIGFFMGTGIFLTLLAIIVDMHLAEQAGAVAWDAFAAELSSKMLPLLAGAGSALVLSAIFRLSEHRLRTALQRLSQALEERIQFTLARPPVQEPLKQLTAAPGMQQENPQAAASPEQFRYYSMEIVNALSRVEKQMTETMPGRIGDAMQPLSEALDMLGKRLSDSNAEALRQAVGELSQGLHSRTVEDLDALSNALSQARGGLEDAGHALRDASALASDRLNEAGEALAGNLGRAGEYAQQALGPLPQQAAEFGGALDRVNAELMRHADVITAAAETAQRAMQVMDEMASRPREFTAATAQAYQGVSPNAGMMDLAVVDDLSRAAREVSSSVETVLDARQALKRLSSRLRQPATSLITEDWGQSRNALPDSDDVLDEVLENFRAGASHQRASLESAVEELETRLDRLFRELDAGAARLQGALHAIRRQPPANAAESHDAA